MVPSQTHPVKLAFAQFTSYVVDQNPAARPGEARSPLDKASESAADWIPTVRNLRHLTWRTRTLKSTKQLDQVVLSAFGDNLDPSVDEVLRGPEQAEFERVLANPPSEANALHPAAYPRGQPGLHTGGVDASGIGVPAEPVPIVIWPGHQRPCRGRRWHRGQL